MVKAAKRRRKRLAKQVDAFLSKEPRLGSVYKINRGIGLDILAEPDIDTTAMSATAVINTPRVDRDREIIIPEGVEFDEYRSNPVVMWEHGIGLIDKPIAKSEHPNGGLAITVTGDVMEATSYFTDRNRESEQIFALVDEGIVRATSIHVDPIEGTPFFQNIEGERVLVFPRSKMLEWSWGSIGVNPEAIAKVLDRNRLAGSAICQPLLKSLRPYMPTLKTLVRGTDILKPRKRAMNKGIRKGLKKFSDDELEEAKTEAVDEDDSELTKAIEDEQEVREETAKTDGLSNEELVPRPEDETIPKVEGEPEVVVDEDESMLDQPLGAQVLKATFTSMTDMTDQLKAAQGPLENPAVQEFVAAVVEGMENQLMEVEGLHSTTYPDMDPLTKAEGDPAEEEVTEEEALKSWLRNGSLPALRLAGLGSKLKSLSSAKNLDKGQRIVLRDVIKHLSRITSKAKTMRKPSKEIQELKDTFSGLEKQLAEMTPANAR